jgi:hypothetical protein
MSQLATDEHSATIVPTRYEMALAQVRRLTRALAGAVDDGRRCGPDQRVAVLVELHNLSRDIAATLNQALGTWGGEGQGHEVARDGS